MPITLYSNDGPDKMHENDIAYPINSIKDGNLVMAYFLKIGSFLGSTTTFLSFCAASRLYPSKRLKANDDNFIVKIICDPVNSNTSDK